MSKYQELCDLYGRARTRALERRGRCAAVFTRLGARIQARLEIPDSAFAWRSVEQEPDESAPPPALEDAMSVADDGHWHVGLQILLRAGEGEGSELPVFFDLRVHEEGDQYTVSVSDEDPGRTVRPGSDADLDEVADDTERRLRRWLDENLDRVLGATGHGASYGQYL